MMKKRKIVLIVVLVIVTIVMSIELYNNHWDRNYGSFELDDYRYNYEAPYDSYVYLGEIKTSADARRKAEKLWKAVYGDWVVLQKPYRVSFDEQNRVWFVSSSYLLTEQAGPYLLVQENGKVLCVWSDHLF